MKFSHGGLAISIPDHWSDQSTLLFVAPASSAQLPTTASVRQPTEAVSITFLSTGNEPGDGQQVLREQQAELGALDPDFSVISEGPFSCELGAGWSCVQRLTIDGGVIIQPAVAIPLPAVTVLATAAATEGRFAHQEAELRRILGSLSSAG